MAASVEQESGQRPGFWAGLQQAVSLADYRPRPAAGVVAKRQGGSYVLKSPQARSYMRLSTEEHALWAGMDGQHTVRELAVDYFLRQHRFVPIAELVRRLRGGGFLADPPAGLRTQLQAAVARQEEPWGRRVLELLWGRPVSIRGIGRFFRGLYRLGGRFLFTRPAALLQLLVALAGFAAFIMLLVQGRQGYEVLQAGGSYILGLLLLLLLNVATLSLHESAHALATIHQGCEVYRGGFLFYLGLPTLFVDTTDTWMVGKRGRVRVVAAGPWADLVIGGLCALLALPAWGGGTILLKIATLAYISALFNLNPLAEMDGYYVLSDLLGLPYLRRDALAFVRGEMWPRLRRRQAFSPRERLYAIYGSMAVLYLVVLAGLLFLFWRTQVTRLMADILRLGPWGQVLLGLLAALVGVPLVWLLGNRLYRAGRHGWQALVERGYLARGTVRLLIVAGASLVLALLLRLVPAPWLRAGLPLLLYTVAIVALVAVLPSLFGTPFRRVLLALAAVLLLLAASSVLEGGWGALQAGSTLARLAQAGALGVALAAFSAEDLLRARWAERAAMAALLGGAFVLAVSAVRGVPPDSSLLATLGVAGPVFLGGLALALLVPTLVSFSGTPFAPSWVLFALALALSLAWPAGVAGPLETFELHAAAAFIMAQGAVLYLLAQRYMPYRAEEWGEGAAEGTHARLRQAFAHFYASLFAIFRDTFGRRRAQVLDDRLDILAITADWLVAVDGGRLHEAAGVESCPLEQLAAQYTELLERSLDIMAGLAGRPFLRRAIQVACDGLPWAEREVLVHHVLRQTGWGEAVSGDFLSRQEADLRLLAGVPLFWGSDEAARAELRAALRPEQVSAGRVIAYAGKTASALYVVAMGKVEVWQEEDGRERLSGELYRGDSFGEEALLEKPFPATYRAALDTSLLRVDGATLERVWQNRPLPPARIRARAGLFSQLAGLDLFREMPWHDLQAIAVRMEERQVPAGEIVVAEGQPADAFYLIAEGRVVAATAWGSREEEIRGELGPGEYLNEIAAFLGEKAAATVVTKEPCTFWTLPAREFRRFLERSLGA